MKELLETRYLYLILNLLTVAPVFLLSFDRKVAYYKRWQFLFPAILLTGGIFIIWDVIFTHLGIWGFNPEYLSGIQVVNLPLEEWLFFITIPFASVFIYDCIKFYFPEWSLTDFGNITGVFLGIILTVFAILNLGKHYTYITFISLSFILLFLVIRRSDYLGRFFVSYTIVLIPFYIVNGILTGSWISAPVVWYNDGFNLDLRVGTIPIEDIFYGMLLILLNVSLYEYFQKQIPGWRPKK